MRHLSAALLLLVVACHHEPPRAVAPIATSVRYLALGDSFTAGTGSPAGAAFPVRLAALLGGELANVAANGLTSRDVVERELPALASFRPTYVTLAIGANDIVRDTGQDAFRSHVATIVRAVLDAGVAPANLVGLPQPEWPLSPTGQRFGGAALLETVGHHDAILREAIVGAGGRWAALEPLMHEQALAAAWAPDGLHPDAASHAAWATFIAEHVRPVM